MNNVFTYFRSKTHTRVIAVVAAGSLLNAMPFSAFALPQGGTARSGNVSWNTVGNTMTVNQLSSRAIINWDSFSIGGAETVQFLQPGTRAAILNRVTGPYSSDIFGSLLANGNVYLINPNGILFGAGARVNVGGLVASTFDLSDEDFNLGRLSFRNHANTSGKVVNHGNITAAAFAYLIGAGVENHGSITAPAVALAAGRDSIVIDRTVNGGEIRLSVDADMPPISFTAFDNPANMANVINSGTINASGTKGGDVILQGENVVQTGTVRADGIAGDGGRVRLLGERLVTLGSDSVTTANAGLHGYGGRIELVSQDYLGVYERAYIAARGGSLSGNGGFVETSGHKSFILDAVPDVGAANGRGGEWLIDPYNITIDAVQNFGWGWSGNDMMAANDNTFIRVDYILAGLANGDVTIRTGSGGTQDGNITVNADIGYTGYTDTTLTLEAAKDIALNANITAGTDNTLGLTAGGDVNQAAGKVVQLGTVAFDVAGDVTMQSADNRIDTLTGTVGGDLKLVNDRTLELDALHVDTGATTLDINGNLTNERGNTIADLTARTAGDILLGADNDFGEVTANANHGTGAITLSDVNGIILRDIDGGTLTVNARDGSITQKAGTRVEIGDTSDLTATDQITLLNRGNDFGGPVSAKAKGIQLRDRNNIELDMVTAGVDGLFVNTLNGDITQTDGGSVSVAGETTLVARRGWGYADITLDNYANNFVGAVHAYARNIALADQNDILLGRIRARGTLDVTAGGGSITQTYGGGNYVRARGETTLYATGDITLDNVRNDFIDGPVHANAENIALTDRNAILLGSIRARGTLDVIALNGDITQTGLDTDGIIAHGEATLTARGNRILADSEHNDFQDTVNAYGDTIRITDGKDGIAIGTVNGGGGTAAGLVVINALNGGDITDAQGETVGHDAEGFATITDPRTVNITADNLLLLADGDIGGAGMPLDINAGTLAARAGGSVWLFESDALTIGTVDGVSGIRAMGNAKVETIDGTLTLNSGVWAGRDVLLAANGADADVVLNRTAGAFGNLTVLAARDVRQNATLLAGGAAVVEAKDGDILMGGDAATVAGGGLLYRSGGDIALTTLRGGDVRIEAGGDITDANLNNAPNIIAQTAQLVAGGSVGSAGGTASDRNRRALDTIVGTLAVDAGQNVYIRNSGALTIGDVGGAEINRVALDSTTTPLASAALSGATAGNNLKIVNTRGPFNVESAVTATGGDLLLWAQNGALGILGDVTAGGLLTLAGEGIRLDANLSGGGDVTLDAGGGGLTFNTGYTIDAGSIRLTAGGDIALDRLSARDAVSVVAGGDITDANEDDTANITASRIRLQAGGSIGAGDGEQSDDNAKAVNVAADNLEAFAGGSIYLQSEGALTLGGVGDVDTAYARFNSGRTTVRDPDLIGVTARDGVLKIKAGALTVAETLTAGTDALLMTTDGALTLNAALNAGRHATLAAAGALNQNADISAGGDISLSGSSILTASGITLHGGNVRYASPGDIALGFITADGLVNIVAGGNITDANHDTTPNITADRIRLDAGGFIGTAGDALDIEANLVAAWAGGEAHLRSEGDITIGAIGQVETDYARFNSGVSTVVDPPLAGLTTGGDASLVSGGGNIRQTPDGDVDIGGATWLEALNGDVTLENPNNDFHGQVDGTARNILLRDRNDLFVGRLEATPWGHVRLTAGGSILASCGCEGANVIAGTAEFYAGHDIGHPLYLDVGTILNARAGNDIYLTQIVRNMNILGQVHAGRNVILDVWHGGIVDADNDGRVPRHTITPDNADIYAGGYTVLIADFVGALRNPLELISMGPLRLKSHRPAAPQNGTDPWVVVNGNVGGGQRNIFVDQVGIPGLVLYNGEIIWGPWRTTADFQLAQRSLADNDQVNLLGSGIASLPLFLQPDTTLFAPSAVRDDLREAEEKRVTGAEEEVPDNEPRVKVIGLPVTSVHR